MSAFGTSALSVPITADLNKARLDKLTKQLPQDADRVANKHAIRMLKKAIDLAPSSAKTRARGKDSNNPHDTTLKQSITKVKLINGQYRIKTAAPWARHIVYGTRAHDIPASGNSSKLRYKPSTRKLGVQINKISRHINALLDVKIGYEHITVGQALGKKKANSVRKVNNRRAQADKLEKQIDALEERQQKLANRINAINSGQVSKGMLSFYWTKGRRLYGDRVPGNRMFIGPVVHHDAKKGNNFLAQARSAIALGFYADMEKLLRGDVV